jgi:ketosteroid isomerase-like protein
VRIEGDVREARRVVEADESWLAAFNRGDVEALVAIYDPDVVVMPPDRADLHGRAAVAAWLAEVFRESAARQVILHDEVGVEGRTAFLRGRFELELTTRASGEVTRLRGKHLVLWRRDTGGAWLAYRDLWSVAAATG